MFRRMETCRPTQFRHKPFVNQPRYKRIVMLKRLQFILVIVLAALLASPVGGGFAVVAISHGAVASSHGHDHDHGHDMDELSEVEMSKDARPVKPHGQGHDASDHVPGNLLLDHEHKELSLSPVKSGNTLKVSKSFNQPPLERPPRLASRV